jgi:uncharacterized membrane protein YGL010W
MMTANEYLDEYAKTHRNPTNQIIHFLCVPVILISTLGLGWLVNAGLLGVEAPWARWVNLSTVLSVVFLLFFYSRLGWRILLAMTAFMALSFAVIVAVEASPLPLLWTAVVAWVAAWIVQGIGHHIEGAKPSFFDDLVFLLIGPLFVLEEFGLRLRP